MNISVILAYLPPSLFLLSSFALLFEGTTLLSPLPLRMQRSSRTLLLPWACHLFLIISALSVRGTATASAPQGVRSDSDSDSSLAEPSPASLCNRRCKPAYIGDGHCDAECNTEACLFDNGDCDGQWELQRMLVMGEHYTYVDHVEYHKVNVRARGD